MEEKWELYHDTVISFGDGGIDVRNAPKAKERARLIASAPQLLEALELARDYIYSELQEKKSAYGDRLQHKIKIIQDDLDKADAAIAAAKGE